MRVHESARKHGIAPHDAIHAAEHAVFVSDLDDDSPARQLRTLGGGRTAFWRHGTVVIRNPRAPDGGTAFQTTDGYDYFLNQLH